MTINKIKNDIFWLNHLFGRRQLADKRRKTEGALHRSHTAVLLWFLHSVIQRDILWSSLQFILSQLLNFSRLFWFIKEKIPQRIVHPKVDSVSWNRHSAVLLTALSAVAQCEDVGPVSRRPSVSFWLTTSTFAY